MLADTWWRLLRIPHLEAALHAKGRAEGLDELETHLKYEKQFRNLALQERRLFNYAARLRAELDQRKAEQETETGGFEFSTAAITEPEASAPGLALALTPGQPSSMIPL